MTQTSHEKILLARCRELDPPAFNAEISRLESAVAENDTESLTAALAGLVPEFSRGHRPAASNVVSLEKAKA